MDSGKLSAVSLGDGQPSLGPVTPSNLLAFGPNSRVIDVGKFGVHKLPPCRVCGAQATGYHYGANTCEACKGFFHRSLSKKDTYICLKNSKCELKPGNRSLCPFCRYRRCVEVGMSKKGIKTGRYSYAKRTQDILEIQGYHGKSVSPGPESPPVVKEEWDQEKVQDIEQLIGAVREARDRFVLAQVQNSKQHQAELQIQNLANLHPQLIASIQRPPDVNVSYPAFKPDVCSNVIVAPDSSSDDKHVLNVWVKAIGSRTGGLRNTIDFIKEIPGFKELAVGDQIQLIKYSIAELWIIGRHASFNAEMKQFTSTHGLTFDLNQAVGPDLADLMCRVAGRLQKMELDKEEIFLLTCFIVVYTDRCALENAEAVERIQQRLCDAVLYVLKNKYGAARYLLVFANLVAVLTELRSVTNLYLNMTDKLVTNAADMPPLLTEILTLC